MEEVVMLRQLINQLQEFVQVYGAPPPPPPLPRHHPLQLLNQQPRCSSSVDESSLDDYYNYMMAAGQSGSVRILDPAKPPPSKKSRKERIRGKSSATTNATEPMEQHIWKNFPDDLYEAVIARLPIATFFRFRSVCRKWNSLLDSESFSQHCEEIPQTNPWFYTITHENVNSGAMYDPSLKKWHHPMISSLPTKLIVYPVASAGGLVCFLDIGNRKFYLCNPLNQSYKELPARSVKVWSRIAVGMTLNGSSTNGGYKIMWVGCDGEYEVYDSLCNSWTRPGSMPSSVKLPLCLNFRSQAVTIGSTLYFMRSRPDGIVSYDMVTGVWKEFIIPTPLHLTDHTLAECGGQIMLVGLLSKNAATCVCIWELQKMTLLWKEVDRMPNIWCLEIYGKHVRMTCLGNKGLLMLSLRSRQLNPHVVLEVETVEPLGYVQCLEQGMVEGSWLCGAAREEAAMDCMRYFILSMPHCCGLIQSRVCFGVSRTGMDFQFAIRFYPNSSIIFVFIDNSTCSQNLKHA